MFVGTLVPELLLKGFQERGYLAERIKELINHKIQNQCLIQGMESLEMSLNDKPNEVNPFLPHTCSLRKN